MGEEGSTILVLGNVLVIEWPNCVYSSNGLIAAMLPSGLITIRALLAPKKECWGVNENKTNALAECLEFTYGHYVSVTVSHLFTVSEQ